MSDWQFLGYTFAPVGLEHQETIEHIFHKFPQKLSGYTFAGLFGWSVIYRHAWTTLSDGTTLFTTYIDTLDQYHLLQPIGNFSIDVQQELLERILKWEYPVKLFGVTKEFIENFSEFCSYFQIQDDRGLANYLYKAKDLALLEGRPYERKRNLISQVDKVYHWTLKPLEAHCEDCPRILLELGNKENGDDNLQKELLTLKTILKNYDHLHLKGYMIGIDGKAVAFSIVDVLNPSTKVVLFEKADRYFKGLYQLINRETSKAIVADGYELINREEDIDNGGLRQAKMSYHPIELISSYTLTILS